MAVGTKRKRAVPNGLAAGERLKRDKLAGAELYSQWGWISRISDPSQITLEHCLSSYGFQDNLGKPLCKNKYAELDDREHKKRRVDVAQETKPKPAEGEDADDFIVISSDDEEPPLCNKKRCKENPQCVNYVGQVKLEKDDALQSFLEVAKLGPSPLNSAREPDLPIGLKNLGATCYANAFLQVWFQDHAFRDGVYRCKPSQEEGMNLEDSPIFQLQVTFAALQESTQNVFNPVKLVESLQLRASEQQDAQEFSKLFMSHLATEFEKQAVPSLKTLISDQFEGKQTYGTMCRNCRHRSERDTDFLELEINLENNGKLEERIEALLHSEELTDDNKYHCARCDGLQDATRYTKLRRLPPVLHFSVLRFVFDLSTLSRKKSKQAILFPLILDMSPFLDNESSDSSGSIHVPAKRRQPELSNLMYELRGVLLHKGSSAYHGHYEAQVFDVTTNQFYQFNDETVTPIASLQSRKVTSNGGKDNGDDSVSAVANKKRRTYTRKKVRVDSDTEAEAEKRPDSGNGDQKSSYISSKDAYMLIYARREAGPLCADQNQIPEPPLAARERVADLNKLHDNACVSYMEREQNLTQAFKQMRQKKLAIYRHWEIGDPREVSAVVSRNALEDWLAKNLENPTKKEHPKEGSKESPASRESSTDQAPDVIGHDPTERSESPCDPFDLLAVPKASEEVYRLDNPAIVCRHGKLDPSHASEMKRIKQDALATIRAETGYFFEPEMTTADVCESCVKEMFIEKRYTLDHPLQVSHFDELCELENDTQGAWISKPWLKDWRQAKPKMHVTGKGDPPPDAPGYVAHVKCVHDRLSLLSTSRKWINGESCAFLRTLFPTWQLVMSRSEDARVCEACNEELNLSKETKQEQKKRIEFEKSKLRNLISTNILAMDPEIIPGVSQAIVPANFLRQWRAWISRPQEKPRPGPVDNTWLLCEHDRLVIDPNVPNDLGTSISLVPLSQWEILHGLYGGGPLIALTGTEQYSQESQTTALVTHDFEVCHECRSERLSNFETATITIRILSDDEPNPTPDGCEGSEDKALPSDTTQAKHTNGTSGNHSKRGRGPLRTSNRLRRSKRKAGRKDVTIQKSSTVKDIKIELHNELGIPTICQRLFFKGVELTESSETTASLGIIANDTLVLREEKENDDVLNSDAEHEHGHERRDEGRAFGGTILSGLTGKTATPSEEGLDSRSSTEIDQRPNHCPVCTFINPDDQSLCSMCGSGTNI